MDNVLLVGRGQIELTEREMLMLASVDDVLKKANLALYCPRCYLSGINDGGLRGNNAVGDKRWTIECGCSVRMAKNPTQSPHSVV